MQPPEEMKPRRRRTNRARVLLGLGGLAVFLFFTSIRGLAGFWTDYLWFDSLSLSSVWASVLWAKIGLGLLFTAIFFVAIWISLFIADRLAPKVRPPGPEDELSRRWQQFTAPRSILVRSVISLLFALLVGAGVSSQWQSWLFFTNRVDFGIVDQQFGIDVGFYVFQLPFLTFVVNWAFAAILVILVVTTIEHYLNGGIRLQGQAGSRVTPQVKAHLSLLLGLLALIKGAGYYLDRYELTLSERGFVTGATYTDVKAQLPALQLLMIVSVFCFGLLIFNIWRRGFTYPIIAVGLWALVASLAGTIYPALVQRFQVEPSESTKEAPYIERNIEMTRIAMGLDRVTPRDFDYEPTLSASEIEENLATVRNVRLLDPAVMRDTFQQTQGIKSFYDFRDIDVDRYEIDGRTTQVVLAARELKQTDLPNNSWESEHIAFTHGYGIAAAPANAIDANGRPDYALADIPVAARTGADSLEVDMPGLYIGEGLQGYAIVGATRDEVDFQDNDDRTEVTRYDGADGVEINSLPRKLAFALRFAEPNLVVSGELGSESRILYKRDVVDRAKTLAPFLKFDSDPYPAVIDGKVMWILDAYTSTDMFPYAERVNPRAVRKGDLRSSVNYVRNSIKLVVDAYDGTPNFYVVDDADPIAKSYQLQFPNLFSEETPSTELTEHFRYPEDLFRMQTEMWGRYRITEASEFYDAAGAWSVAQDPGNSIGQTAVESVIDASGNIISSSEVRIAPQYLLMRLPGDEDESFVIFRPFVPFSDDDSRKNLEGFMVVHNDPERYGEIEVYEIRSSTPVDGPALFNSNIQTEEEISERVTLLNQNGSTVVPGNLLLIPVENSLLYVRPLYIEATGTTAVPELQLVIVGVGPEVKIADSFEAALAAAIPGLQADVGPGPISASPDPESSSEDDSSSGAPAEPDDLDSSDELSIEELLAKSREAFDQADAALRAGDLAGYQRWVESAAGYIAKAQRLLGQASSREEADSA
ncbi:MAG: hypothetical protein CMQ83_01680 [Gammaproteobacteria bacterium]|nr:hypothetical protein [Gammaproteobacteria bacterium]|tara:strand:- start:450 stop:3404 length:2955 start_codon:yes stop_codon:yes gene_type:complete